MRKKSAPAEVPVADALQRLKSDMESLGLIVESIGVVAIDKHANRVQVRAADGAVTIAPARLTRAEQRARKEQQRRERFDQMVPIFPKDEFPPIVADEGEACD